LGLPIPISVSIKEGLTAEIYRSLVGVALDPSVAVAGGPPSNIWNYSMIGISAALLVGGIAVAWKIYRN
jgi:Ras family protein T1